MKSKSPVRNNERGWIVAGRQCYLRIRSEAPFTSLLAFFATGLQAEQEALDFSQQSPPACTVVTQAKTATTEQRNKDFIVGNM